MNAFRLSNLSPGHLCCSSSHSTKRVSFIMTLVACSIGLITLSHADLPPDRVLTDSDITNAVEHRFLTDAVLLNNQVDAKTQEGIVTLSGTADHLIAKDRAVKLAETIRGVRGVVNTIDLTKSDRSDEEVRMDVAAALIYDAATDELTLKPEVEEGVVTLEGTVHSYGQKQLAVRVVKGVKGVRQVLDNILVETTAPRTDAEIAEEITRMISTDVWLDGAYIATQVKEGVVNLIGQVGTPAQQDRAGDLAWTIGVKFVHTDNLKIDPWMKRKDQSKETVVVRTDAWIQKAVRDALVADPRVDSFEIGVEVFSSVVTLTGVVDNIKGGTAAEQDATNTTGVVRVRNLLKVRVQYIADAQLVQNVNAALLRDSVLDGDVIEVRARNGVVTLSGHVDSYYEQAQADDVASRANGTRAVKNNLSVNNTNVPYYFNPYWEHNPFSGFWNAYRPGALDRWIKTNDMEIKDDIVEQLIWSPFVESRQVNVMVENGVATLTGTVDSAPEYRAAAKNAYDGGARLVVNNLKVK